MCHERERLIGYFYDECDSSERAAVQQHLETCAECRDEMASLRSVREDLAAWEVPEHGSVWKPFAPVQTARWWHHVPQWALAAAAGIVLVSGAAGGAVTHAFISHEPPTTQASAGVTQVSDTREMAAMQQQIAMLRAELAQVNDRVQKTSASAITPDMEAALHKTFDRQLSDLQMQNASQLDAVQSLYRDVSDYKRAINFKVTQFRSELNTMAELLPSRAGGQQ